MEFLDKILYLFNRSGSKKILHETPTLSNSTSDEQSFRKAVAMVEPANGKQLSVPIETELGTLGGRDCILLDDVSIPNTRTVIISGRINGAFNPDGSGDHTLFTLTFSGVIALKITELESCAWVGESSFSEVTGSVWLDEVATGDKYTNNHKQYLLQTYDDVFEFICTNYSFEI